MKPLSIPRYLPALAGWAAIAVGIYVALVVLT